MCIACHCITHYKYYCENFLLGYLYRCVAKYWEIHERVGKKLQKMSTQDEEALKKLAAEQGLIK